MAIVTVVVDKGQETGGGGEAVTGEETQVSGPSLLPWLRVTLSPPVRSGRPRDEEAESHRASERGGGKRGAPANAWSRGKPKSLGGGPGPHEGAGGESDVGKKLEEASPPVSLVSVVATVTLSSVSVRLLEVSNNPCSLFTDVCPAESLCGA